MDYDIREAQEVFYAPRSFPGQKFDNASNEVILMATPGHLLLKILKLKTG